MTSKEDSSTAAAVVPVVQQHLTCDYLVVGAGTAGLSFVDTVLTHNLQATIIIVDRNSRSGGHWTQAYPFVKLHQPSCFYGVNSVPLGGRGNSGDDTKMKGKNAKERFDIHDRATGTEILEYYQTVCDEFKASGRVRFFFHAEYVCNDNKTTKKEAQHTIIVRSNANETAHNNTVTVVTCRKLVTVASDVTVPSMRKPLISVHESVHFVPVNEVLSAIQQSGTVVDEHGCTKYIVFGNGKTGVDAITHMLRDGILPSDITWVLGRENWYFVRDAIQDFYGMFQTMAHHMLSAPSVKAGVLAMEADGLLCRIDPHLHYPEVYKGALVDTAELALIRSIKNCVRKGRATEIGDGRVVLERGTLDFSTTDTLLVDCMVDQFYGYSSLPKDFCIFEPGRINLGPTLAAETEAVLAKKNGSCYFLRGKHNRMSPDTFIGAMYMQIKSFDALVKVKGGVRFLFGSRTNMSAPCHHEGGIPTMLWNFLGPKQLHTFGPKLIEKIEAQGFRDLDHCFGIETFPGAIINPGGKQSTENKNTTNVGVWWFYFVLSVGVLILAHVVASKLEGNYFVLSVGVLILAHVVASKLEGNVS